MPEHIAHVHVPSAPLSRFVECLWHAESRSSTRPAPERVFPPSAIHLVIDLRSDRHLVAGPASHGEFRTFRSGLVIGPRTEHFVTAPEPRAVAIGVQLRPIGALPLLGRALPDLPGAFASSEDVWGSPARVLRERLVEAADVASRFRILEQFLSSRLDHEQDSHPAVRFAAGQLARPGSRIRVRDLVERIGISHRWFLHLFRAQTGFTPKTFRRLHRFQEALARMQARPDLELAQVALDCGFADQAHFIHDFRALTGLRPSAYLRIRGDRPNHVPLQ